MNHAFNGRIVFSANMRKLGFASSLLATVLLLLVLSAMLPRIQASGNDDWPMFHHDLQHSGYSTSTAPNTNYKLWNYTTGGWVSSSPAAVHGEIYVGSNDNEIYCLNASTGALIWNFTTGGPVSSSPAVADDRVYVGSFDGNVYCLDASNGALTWNYATGGFIVCSPAVAYGNVYAGSGDKNVYCLNASTGAFVWNFTTGAGVFSSPAIFNGNVYIGSDDNRIYCLNASTGALIWKVSTGGLVESSPAVSYGYVYFGSYDRNVYCLNASTGALIWNFTTGAEVFSSPAVAYGNVYVGSFDRNIYCLNASTGALVWNYTTNDEINGSPAIAYGNVYIASGDYKIYCFAFVDITPPNITGVSQAPPKNNVSSQDIVEVNATVTDDASGVKEVTLSYASNNGAWTNVTMSNLLENVWSASIPAFPYGTNVTYIIIAQDNAGNAITTLGTAYEHQYVVIPEFPTPTIALPLFMIFTLLAVGFRRRKQLRHQN